MVGVPGRSKGCSTCRRRKKGCDLARPSCSQCVRAGIQCEGYERARIFVNSTQANVSFAGPAPSYSVPSDGNAVIRRAGPASVRARPGAPPPDPTLPDGLRRAAYLEKYLGDFWMMLLPQGRTFAIDPGYASASWTKPVQALYVDSTLVRAALMANCLLRMGIETGDRWMIEESFRLYLNALRAIRNTLKTPKRALSDETLAAIKLMMMFEIYRPADKANQLAAILNHIDAHWPLLRARGPEAHVDGHGHHMFVSGRVPLIVSCLIDRRECALASPAWKTIPFQRVTKSPRELLVDIFADLPGLVETADRLKTLPPQEIPARIPGLIARCYAFDAELLNWKETISPVKDWTPILSQTPEEFEEKDLYDVYLASLYLSIATFLYTLMHGLMPGQLPERMKISGLIQQILQCLTLLFTPVAGALGGDAALMPLAMVLQYVAAVPAVATQKERDTLVKLYQTPIGRHLASASHFKDAVERIMKAKEAEAKAALERQTPQAEVPQAEAGSQGLTGSKEQSKQWLANFDRPEYENARDMVKETEEQRIATEQWSRTQQKAKAAEAKVLDQVHAQIMVNMVVSGDAVPMKGKVVEKRPAPLQACKRHRGNRGDLAWSDDAGTGDSDEEFACECYGGHRRILLGDLARQVKLEKSVERELSPPVLEATQSASPTPSTDSIDRAPHTPPQMAHSLAPNEAVQSS